MKKLAQRVLELEGKPGPNSPREEFDWSRITPSDLAWFPAIDAAILLKDGTRDYSTVPLADLEKMQRLMLMAMR